MARFTERAQRVILIAQEEARRLQHGCVEPLHILSALIALGEGVACQILIQGSLSHRQLRDEVMKKLVTGNKPQPIGESPFTPQAKKVLEHAVEEAQEVGHSWVGTEHLLLGLFHTEIAGQILNERGFKLGMIREEVIRILGKGDPHPSDIVKPTNLGQQFMVLALAPEVSGVLVTTKPGTDKSSEIVIIVSLKSNVAIEAAYKSLAPILPAIKGLRFKRPGQRPMSWSDGAWKEDLELNAELTF